MTTRIMMTEGHVEELSGGARRIFRGGQFYNVDNDVAGALIGDGKAYDERDPPACPECGEEFTGEHAYRLRDGHMEAEHPEEETAEPEEEGDALAAAWIEADATEAAVGLGNEHGVHPSEVAGTGEDGRITKPDVEAVIEES